MATNLKARVAASTSSAAPALKQPATLTDQIRSMQAEFQLAMPRGAEAQQLVRDALTCLRQTPKLGQCEPATVLGALMTCSQLGLRPGVLGHAYLLPFWDNKSKSNKAQLVIGYQGLLELIYRSGAIESIAARVVYENDEYDLVYELAGDKMVHRPCLTGPRGKPRLYYAVARMKGGGYTVTDPMTQADMEAYRDRHATAKTKDGRIVGPWRDHFEAMGQKTTLRQLSKWLPKSTELASAIEADGRVRIDLTPDGIDHTTYIDGDAIDGEVVEDSPAAPAPSAGPAAPAVLDFDSFVAAVDAAPDTSDLKRLWDDVTKLDPRHAADAKARIAQRNEELEAEEHDARVAADEAAIDAAMDAEAGA